MKGIDRAGKRKAIENSPTSEDSTTSPPAQSGPAWVAPDALRRRTAEGDIAGQGRVNVAPRQSELPRLGANVSSADPSGKLPVGQLPLLSEAALQATDDFGTESDAGVAFHQEQAASVEQPPRLSIEVLNRYAKDLEKLTPLITEVKDGLATLHSISKRPGGLGATHFLNPDCTLKPASFSKMAKIVHDKLQAIRQSHPEVAQEFETAVGRPAPQRRLPLPLDQCADDLKNLIPLILELKEGVATVNAISKRAGIGGSFRHTFNPDGTLKPASASDSAKSIHNKLEAIRQSHPEVAEAFEAAIAAPMSPLNRFANELKNLIPLINELKEGLATRTAISNRAGIGDRFRSTFNPDGTLKPASTHESAKSIHKKLQAIRQSHPEVAQAFEAAISRPASQKALPLDKFANDLKSLIPLILELKDGLVSARAIARRAGMSDTFRHTFNPDGTLKPASANRNAKSMHNKLQAVRQSHPEVAEAFEAALARPQRKAPPRTRRHLQAHHSAPLAINEFGARRHELARLILQIRQRAVSLQDAETSFPGLSRLIDPSGLWRNEHELALAFDELVAPHEQENFFRLRQEVDELLVPGALPPGESSARAAPAQAAGADVQHAGSAERPRLMFDLNQPWVEPDAADEPPTP